MVLTKTIYIHHAFFDILLFAFFNTRIVSIC